ncbi:MAG TPA: AtpZ/AtpI family protein [Alphaproteobacteria bacterium]|nr:AtpZ/AtpI family protein [Alphaproteobacteria bacterium]
MSEKKPPPALRELDARLREARDRQERRAGKAGARRAEDMSGVGLALRLGVDFVAGVVVGVGVGLLLDWWMGSSPAMLIVFFVLGAAAGTFNVFRTASGQSNAVGYRQARENGEDAKDANDTGAGDAKGKTADKAGKDTQGGA